MDTFLEKNVTWYMDQGEKENLDTPTTTHLKFLVGLCKIKHQAQQNYR